MQINSNITALVTNNALLRNESAFSLSTGKLSSGYKINTAGDDPTGYAISGRMRQQLEALKRADTNATTGKSVLETADGALSEVTDMLQRLNELAIKASNGTMSESDRADVQSEVDQLTAEIQRISDQIELNGQKLLDGHLENHGYCENSKYIRVEEYNDKVSAGKYTLTEFKEWVSTTTDANGNTVSKLNISVKGFPSTSASDNIDIVIDDYPGYLDPAVPVEGYDGKAETACMYNNDTKGSVKICDDGSQYITLKGDNGEELTIFVDARKITMGSSDYYKDSQRYSIDTYQFDLSDFVTAPDTTLDISLTGQGAMKLHVGANEEEVIECSLPRICLERIDIDNLSVKTQASAQESIDRVDYALRYVSSTRAQIGAYTNRVEHSISYLAASNENLTSAMSRIQDTDMAEEMTNYASQQILVQAATSMLAQANQAPQQALQLIQ